MPKIQISKYSKMRTIRVITSFDVTQTNIFRSFTNIPYPYYKGNLVIKSDVEWELARKQQSNFEVITQIAMLRALVEEIATPKIITHFHNNKAWEFTFDVPNLDVYGGNDLHILKSDSMHVPMLVGLNETINEHKYLIPDTNIIYEALPND